MRVERIRLTPPRVESTFFVFRRLLGRRILYTAVFQSIVGFQKVESTYSERKAQAGQFHELANPKIDPLALFLDCMRPYSEGDAAGRHGAAPSLSEVGTGGLIPFFTDPLPLEPPRFLSYGFSTPRLKRNHPPVPNLRDVALDNNRLEVR